MVALLRWSLPSHPWPHSQSQAEPACVVCPWPPWIPAVPTVIYPARPFLHSGAVTGVHACIVFIVTSSNIYESNRESHDVSWDWDLPSMHACISGGPLDHPHCCHSCIIRNREVNERGNLGRKREVDTPPPGTNCRLILIHP